jgi:hypothetical protein
VSERGGSDDLAAAFAALRKARSEAERERRPLTAEEEAELAARAAAGAEQWRRLLGAYTGELLRPYLDSGIPIRLKKKKLLTFEPPEPREVVVVKRQKPPSSKTPRHRHPDEIPKVTVKQLMWDLGRRKTELAGRKKLPHGSDLTQEKIAARFDLDRSRIQQAEKLVAAGWDLLRSHPEFSANDEFVRWPSVREAARILASERASRRARKR